MPVKQVMALNDKPLSEKAIRLIQAHDRAVLQGQSYQLRAVSSPSK